MSPQPGTITLSWASVLDGIYAGLLVAASGITALDPGTISHPTQQIIVLLIAVASAILARIAGIQASQQVANQFADEVDSLRAENAALKAAGNSAAPQPEPVPLLPSKLTIEYPDGSAHEVTVA